MNKKWFEPQIEIVEMEKAFVLSENGSPEGFDPTGPDTDTDDPWGDTGV